MAFLNWIASAGADLAAQTERAPITQEMADEAMVMGLQLMVYGLTFVFMALVVLYLFVKLMTVVFKEKNKKEE